ncbi:MAG: hypothetical protein SynsKO_02210 [Synoicihabitans sp.]
MKRVLPQVVIFTFASFSATSFLSGQPFNPFNVQSPIDTSGPNGTHQEIHPSGEISTGGVVRLSGELHGSSLMNLRVGSKYRITYFPELGNEVRSLSSHHPMPVGPLKPPEKANPFLAEPFYPHLTTLLAHKKLPANWDKRLKEFAAKRDAAAERIIQKIAALKSLPPTEAAAEWADFTAREAKVLAKLERDRQAWLDRLQNGGWNNDGVTWNNIQRLALVAQPRENSSEFIYLNSLRHFAPGLSLDQRDLLGELIIGIAREAETINGYNTLLISPTGTRLPLPQEMTVEASNALISYLKLKEELQAELLTALAGPNRPQNRVKLSQLTEQLRKSQTPKFELLSERFNALVLAVNESAQVVENAGQESPLLKPDSPLTDLETLARLSPEQRRLLAYSYVSR